MIPTVESILRMIVNGDCSYEQALSWMSEHLRLNEEGKVFVPVELYNAAVALVPLLESGWDEYDDTADQKAGAAACDRLIAVVNDILAAAPSTSPHSEGGVG